MHVETTAAQKAMVPSCDQESGVPDTKFSIRPTEQRPKPLLSICIPTYNRSKFLRVMLQALLPQVAECNHEVEVWVLDNASTDETQEVINKSKAIVSFKSIRNEKNLGPLRNILRGPTELAGGKFVWILGDHNLMVPGALKNVLCNLDRNHSLDVFYVNFKCAKYPEHWPVSANGGYSGPFDYVANSSMSDRAVDEWRELLRPESALCTQSYAHIVRTDIWKRYWQNKTETLSYQNALTTYPHTKMLVDTEYKKPSYYLGSPAITIFNGAQSWGDLESRFGVYLKGLPSLLKSMALQGESQAALREWKNGFCTDATTCLLADAISKYGTLNVAARVIRNAPVERYVWTAFWRSLAVADGDLIARAVQYAFKSLNNYPKWWITNCRPARWIRRLNRFHK